MISLLCRRFIKGLLALLPCLLMATQALASSAGGSMPFNTSMTTFMNNFLPWVFGASVVLWAATCLALAFGEWGDGFKRMVIIVFWLSLALSGTTGISFLSSNGAVI